MANSTIGFQGLTLTAVPVTSFAGALTGSLTAGTVVAAVLDPASGFNRIYNPYTEGYTGAVGPQTGDAASKWLPAVATAGISATTINDQYWQPVFQGGTTQVPQPNNKIGQISLPLTPGSADAVRASSVMQLKLSPNAIVFTTTSTF